MKLSELMMPFHDVISRGNLDVEVIGLTDDSRSVKPGILFIAVKGTKTDGHQYLNAAAAAGAAGLVVESEDRQARQHQPRAGLPGAARQG